jgi:diaminohydroxyphosphoribosylaminopyrimidine deaminase/5-amino-6-(5-phosphoribosylamino)uracil reductase
VFSPQDSQHMARALALAAHGQGATHPNPCVGCVIVDDGEVVGEGWHPLAGQPHAEVYALRQAGERARGATAYVTLEPCAHHGRTPPCCEALVAAGVARVVVAVGDPNPQVAGGGIAALRAAGITVDVGLMAVQAAVQNRGFLRRMSEGRPWLTLKLAASLDGRTAMASGESQWISSAQARADVHRLRARSHAVLTSADTVLADNPRLNCRDAGQVARQPDRIVLDRSLRTPASAQIYSQDGARRLLFTAAPDATAHAAQGVEVQPLPLAADGSADLRALMPRLAECGINEVLVESGPRLAGALLSADCVDELVVYLAPSLLGAGARGLADIPGLERLAERVNLRFSDIRMVGPDLRITAAVVRGK